MAIGLIGRKAGMTRVFTEDGDSVPVTVIHVEPNRVTQVKTDVRDGYRAIQITAGSRKVSRVSKPEAGHFAKAGVEAGAGMVECRLDAGEGEELEVVLVGTDSQVRGAAKGLGYRGLIGNENRGDAIVQFHGALWDGIKPAEGGWRRRWPGRVAFGSRQACRW